MEYRRLEPSGLSPGVLGDYNCGVLALALGQSLPVSDFSDIARLRALAQIADEEQIDALYLEERRGRYLDPYVVLADIAQRDQSFVLGVCQPLDGTRSPSVLAKTLSGLDVCSEGRGAVALGVLDGQNPAPPLMTSEALAVMTHMCRNDDTTFSGAYFSVDDAWNTPRLEREHPPFVAVMPAFARLEWSKELSHPRTFGEVAARSSGYALCEVSWSTDEELVALVAHFRDELAIATLIGAVLVEDDDETFDTLTRLRNAGFAGALCRWPRLPDIKRFRDLIVGARAVR